MATLGEALDGLTNENGSPDLIVRRQQLDSLVSKLLKSEVRLIQERLDALTWSMDFIPNLPMEILLCISDYLTLMDLSVARAVSQTWKNCFTQSDIINHLIKEHFRMTWETSFKNTTPDARLEMFISLSRRENSIDQGNYHSRECYFHGALWTPEPIRRLSKDQVAWTTNEMIFVRSLISGNTTGFVTPERHRVTGLCMRGDCLVAVCVTTTLYAWSIATEKMEKTSLPAMPVLVDTRYGNVLIGLKNGTILKWIIGQSVRSLNLPALPENATVTCLGCDPLSKDAFVRCFVQLVDTPTNEQTRSEPPRKTLRLVAEKFNDECIESSSSIDIHLSMAGRIEFENIFGNKYTTNTTRIPELTSTNGLDENGRYSVTISSKFIKAENCFCSLCSQSESVIIVQECSCVYTFLRVYYDAVEERWGKDAFATPMGTMLRDLTGPAEISNMYFTKNGAMVPVIPDIPHDIPNNIVVVGIEPKDGGSSQNRTRTIRCSGGSDGKSVAYRKLTPIPHQQPVPPTRLPFYYNAGLRYALAMERIPDKISLGPRYCSPNVLELAKQFQIYGNTNFTVLFGAKHYMVWCYDSAITLAKPSDEERIIIGDAQALM